MPLGRDWVSMFAWPSARAAYVEGTPGRCHWGYQLPWMPCWKGDACSQLVLHENVLS